MSYNLITLTDAVLPSSELATARCKRREMPHGASNLEPMW